jgi:hypothetical protein
LTTQRPTLFFVLVTPTSFPYSNYLSFRTLILEEKVLIPHNPQPEPTPTIPEEPDVEDAAANALCVVQLPIDGAILFSLLKFSLTSFPYRPFFY